MARTASSAAAIWARSRPTAGRSRRRRCRPARRAGARSGRQAVRDNYLSTVKPGTGVHGSFYSYRDVYLDLDPTYKDRFGRPLMRMTIDFHDNELKQNAFLTDNFAEIIKAMGAQQVVKKYRKAPTTSPNTRRRISAAAPHGRRSRRPARSIAICRAGTCRTCSSWARAAFRRTPATTRPARWRRWPTGRRTRSATQYLKNPGPLVHA